MFEWKTFFNDFAEEYYSVPYLDKKEHIYALQNYLIAKGMLVEDVDYAIKTLLGEETPVNSWSDRKTHKEEERKRVAEEKPKYAKASGGKYYVKNKETGNVYSVVKPNPEKHDPISREKAEKEVEKGESKPSSNVPEEQMQYFEKIASQKSKSFKEKDISKAEQSRRARVLYAKLQMIAAGKDVKINKVDADNLGLLRISGNARSGQLYIGTALDKAGGLKSASDKSPHYSDRNKHKNELLRNWNKVEEKLKEMGIEERPKFKQGAGYLTDKPPIVDHDPVSMKPGAILENIPSSKGTDLLSKQTADDIEKNQGVSLGEDVFFGKPLDPQKPQTFVDNINFVVDATRDYIENNADDKTKKYFTNFVEDLDGIIESDRDPQEKLEGIRSVIKEEYSELVHNAMELNEDEGKNVLKDYGELATYMLYLAEGKETYLPKSGNYPLADVVLVNRDSDTGEAQTIEGYSIKSQRGKEQQPGSSASEFLKHFSNVYPEHKEKFSSLEGLHRGSINKVKDIKDEEIVKDLETIKSIQKVDSIDEMKNIASELFSKFGNESEKLENFMKKVDRFHREKAKKYNIKYDMEGMGTAIVELLHREYSGMKTLKEMKELNLPSKLKFIEVVVGDENVDIREKGKDFSTSDFGLHDKGYLPLNDKNVDSGPPPRIKQIQYASANLALRTKKK
jgi:hypothetical protein|tara:strand:- start:6258 stop:8294 length:2037 start_codon:yes stop_codon:yes gene_type:complete